MHRKVPGKGIVKGKPRVENRCYRCGRKGHAAGACVKREGSACFYCKKEGHEVMYCPSLFCYNCARSGHKTRECFKPPNPRKRTEESRKRGEGPGNASIRYQLEPAVPARTGAPSIEGAHPGVSSGRPN